MYHDDINSKKSITSMSFENMEVHKVNCKFCVYLNPNKVFLEFTGKVRDEVVPFNDYFATHNLYDISFDSKKNLLTFEFSCGENPVLKTLTVTEKSDGPHTQLEITGTVKGVDIVDILAQCFTNLRPHSPKFMNPSNPLTRNTNAEVTLFASHSYFEDGKRHVKHVELDFTKLNSPQTR